MTSLPVTVTLPDAAPARPLLVAAGQGVPQPPVRGAPCPQDTLRPDLAWMNQAACDGVDPEVFFPPGDRDSPAAKAVCRHCEVQPQCLAYALEEDVHGVWGGTTGKERDALRRNARRRALAVAKRTA